MNKQRYIIGADGGGSKTAMILEMCIRDRTYTSLLLAPETTQLVLFSGAEAVILDIDGIGQTEE